MSGTDPHPAPSARPALAGRLRTIIAFATGLAVAGTFSALVFQGRADANVAPAAPPPDPRLEHLLSLAEAQYDCDSACLAGLRVRADKAAAFEQALGNLQALAREAGEKAAALEAEKAALAEQAGRAGRREAELAGQVEALEAAKAGLAKQAEQDKSALEAQFRQQLAAMQAERDRLAAQKEGRRAERQKELGEALARQRAALEAEHQKQVAALESRLAGAASQLQAARPAEQEAAAPEEPAARREQRKPPAKEKGAPAAAKAAAPARAAQKWTVLGMTASTVVVSSPDGKIVALAAGESADGLTVTRIDLEGGKAETSQGVLAYQK